MVELALSAEARRRRIASAVHAAISPAGFERRTARRWVRSSPEINQFVTLPSAYGRPQLEWGIICPPATAAVWGEDFGPESEKSPICYGLGSTFVWPLACPTINLDVATAAELSDMADDVAADARAIEVGLRPLTSRTAVREFVLAVESMSVPPTFPREDGAVYIAGVLAALDREKSECALISRAKEIVRSRPSKLNEKRLIALEELSAALC